MSTSPPEPTHESLRESCRSLRIAELAVRRRLTAYNAAYLSLAIEERAELATFDAALAAAARLEQVKVIGAAP